MDLNQAMQFIRWDEGRRQSLGAESRAREGLALSREKLALSRSQFALSKEKFAFDYMKELRRMKEQEIQKEKGTISSWINSYHQAKSLAAKNSVIETMKSYYHSLNPNHRAELEPYLKRSPLSPMQVKQKEFWRVNKPPTEPSVEEWKENSYPIAKHLFATADLKAKFDNFMTGTPFEKKSFVGMSEGKVAYRDEKGLVNIFDKEEMQLRSVAEKNEIPVAELIANDGWITSKTPGGSYVEGGKRYDYYLRRNVLRAPFKGETPVITKFANDVSFPSPTKLPTETVKMMQAIIGKDEKNLVATELRKLIEGTPRERGLASAQLSSMSPGFNFSFRTEEAGALRKLVNYIPFIGWLFEDAQTSIGIAATEGVPTRLPVAGFGEKVVYLDRSGRVRNQYGTIIGDSMEEASLRLAEELERSK